MRKMENEICKNRKCHKPLPDGYKHKYCEACRNLYAQRAKNILKETAGVALMVTCLAVASVIGKRDSEK